MYALVVLLSLTTCGAFVGAFVQDRGRRWTVAFALSQAVLLYTHNWGLFLGAGPRGRLPDRRARSPEGGPDRGRDRVRRLRAVDPDAALPGPAHGCAVGQRARFPGPLRGAAGPARADGPVPAAGRPAAPGWPLGVLAAPPGAAPRSRWPPSRSSACCCRGCCPRSTRPGRCATRRSRSARCCCSPRWAPRAPAGRASPRVALTALVWVAFDPPSTKCNVHSVTAAIAPSLRPGDTRHPHAARAGAGAALLPPRRRRPALRDAVRRRWPTSG